MQRRILARTKTYFRRFGSQICFHCGEGRRSSHLEYLLRQRERVVSKDDLIAAVWQQRIVSDAALTTRINVVRSAIADTGEEQRLIKTLPRKGLRFVGAVRDEPGTVGEASVETPRAMKPPDKPSVAVLPFTNL